jgi:HemX protein
MIGILHFGSFALYGIAGTLLGISLAREAGRLPRLATALVAAGVIVHAVALVDYVSVWNQLPLVGLGPALSTLAFLIALGSVVAATLGHAATVGLVLVPVVVVLTGVAALVGISPADEPLRFRGVWFALHVVFAFVGYAGLTVAFAAGLMYLLQFRELKSKHFGAIFRFFPPLDTLDRLGRQGLLVGFPSLTVAVVLGWAWTTSFNGSTGPGSPKLAWVVLSWIVLLAALLARAGQGRKGERGALASVVGFVVVVVLYVILRVQVTQQGTFL